MTSEICATCGRTKEVHSCWNECLCKKFKPSSKDETCTCADWLIHGNCIHVRRAIEPIIFKPQNNSPQSAGDKQMTIHLEHTELKPSKTNENVPEDKEPEVTTTTLRDLSNPTGSDKPQNNSPQERKVGSATLDSAEFKDKEPSSSVDGSDDNLSFKIEEWREVTRNHVANIGDVTKAHMIDMIDNVESEVKEAVQNCMKEFREHPTRHPNNVMRKHFGDDLI